MEVVRNTRIAVVKTPNINTFKIFEIIKNSKKCQHLLAGILFLHSFINSKKSEGESKND